MMAVDGFIELYILYAPILAKVIAEDFLYLVHDLAAVLSGKILGQLHPGDVLLPLFTVHRKVSQVV